jgi:hypothetical protein
MPASAPPRAAPAAAPPPSRLRRWLPRAAAALALLLATAWGAFTWLFHDPFEGDFGDLVGLVPPSAAVVVRFSSSDLAAAPFVRRRVLDRPDVRDALRAAGVDAALERLAREEEGVNAGLPAWLRGVSLRADFLGRETVVFGTPDWTAPERSGFAVATRMSPKGRMLASTFKHARVRREVEARSGLKLQRYQRVYEIDGSAVAPDPSAPPTWYAAVVRDVLVLGNDRFLVTEAAGLAAAGAGASVARRADAAGAFDDRGVPLALFADLDAAAPPAVAGDEEAPGPPATLGERLRAAGGLTALLGLVADPDPLSALQAKVSFPGEDAVALRLRGVRSERELAGLPSLLARLPAIVGAAGLAEAARLAPEGSAFLAARVAVPPGEALKVLVGRLSPELRGPALEGLRKAGTSLDEIAGEIDAVVEPGISVVLDRMPECDALSLDAYGAVDGKFVLPLPGVLLALRERRGAPPGAAQRVLRDIRKWAELDEFAELDGLPDGMAGFRAVPKFLTGDLDLVRPCLAFEGDLVLVASHPSVLRRALEARAGKRRALGDAPDWAPAAEATGEGQVAAVVEAGALRLHLRDQRREVATQRSSRDWVRVRQDVHAKVVLSMMDREELRQAEIQRLVEAEMERLLERNRTFDFQEAKAAYERELQGWNAVRWLALGLAWDDAGLATSLDLRAGDGGEER